MVGYLNAQTNVQPRLGHPVFGLPNRAGVEKLTTQNYETMLAGVQAQYPNVNSIEGLVIGFEINSPIAANADPYQANMVQFFVAADPSADKCDADLVNKGEVLLNYRTANQTYTVLIPAADNPTANSQVYVNAATWMCTSETTGMVSIPGLRFVPFDDGTMVKRDQLGRRMAQVTVWR
ncbi:MAG: hypothetical protein NC548_32340 [Lachnospiraceae bacterium]|nr:hypothetical protein [Lachnospiraceae bacterium]